MAGQQTNGAYAAFMRVKGDQLPTVQMNNSPMHISSNPENGQTVEALAFDGPANLTTNNAPVYMGAGRPEDDEARANMIQLFKNKILTTLPHAETCKLVDELKRLGVHAEEDLKDLSDKDIEDLKTLAPLQKRKLTNYIAKGRK